MERLPWEDKDNLYLTMGRTACCPKCGASVGFRLKQGRISCNTCSHEFHSFLGIERDSSGDRHCFTDTAIANALSDGQQPVRESSLKPKAKLVAWTVFISLLAFLSFQALAEFFIKVPDGYFGKVMNEKNKPDRQAIRVVEYK